MSVQAWTALVVGATFALDVAIAVWSRVGTTAGFYVAGRGGSPLANGMATGADWMSAASFISVAGLISFMGYSAAISHDIVESVLAEAMSERRELAVARLSAGAAVLVAGYFGIRPPGFVAQVVAFAFGLAASSFFPALMLGVFSRRVTREGAIAGMLVGSAFTAAPGASPALPTAPRGGGGGRGGA